MKLFRSIAATPRASAAILLTGLEQAHTWVENLGRTTHALAVGILPALFLLRTTREEIYNFLWALVFAFATLNILSLGARHFESDRRGLTFGEILAILVVLVSIILLAWEMLYLFNVFPLHLAPR
jgi:hypothetical protein